MVANHNSSSDYYFLNNRTFEVSKTAAPSEILRWDFNDSNLDPSDSPAEVKATEGTVSVFADTDGSTGFANDDNGGQALYYTGWDDIDRFYEIRLNARGFQNLILSFDHRKTESGPGSFAVQYSYDAGATFTTLPGTESGIAIFDDFTTSPFDFSSVTELNSNSDVRIRLLVQTPGSSAAGRFYLDNISFQAEPIVPTQLAITSIHSGQLPEKNQSFEIVVEAQNDDGLPAKITAATEIQILKLSGDGVGTIISGDLATFGEGETFISVPVTYNPEETNVVFQAERLSGDMLLSGVSSSTTILENEPENPPSSLQAEALTLSSAELSWTRDLIAGEGVVILAKEEDPVDAVPNDGTEYSANSSFGSGDEIGDGNYVIYKGNDLSMTLDNLDPNTNYHFAAYEFNGQNGTENYNPVAVVNSVLTCVTPLEIATQLNYINATAESFTLTWGNGDGQARYVLMNASNNFTSPTDGVEPGSANRNWGNSGEQVMYSGSENFVEITGIQPLTEYFFRIYEYNCDGPEIKYSPSFASFSFTSALFHEDFSECSLSGWKNILIRGNAWSCSNGQITANGMNATANSETWLISPPINFTLLDNESLSFNSFTSGTDGDEAYPQLLVLYSELYSGTGNPDLPEYSWQDLDFIPPEENSSLLKFSGHIDLSDKTSTNGRIAFRYKSSGNSEGNTAEWKIDDVLIEDRECSPPTVQANNIRVSDLTTSSATLDWTKGNGFGSVVVINEGSGISNNPQNGTEYTGDTSYGSGENLGDDHYVVYQGDGSSINVTGFDAGTQYSVKVFEYNRCANPSFDYHYNTSDASANPTSFNTYGSQLSDVIIDPAFIYPQSIPYQDYLGSSIDHSNSLEVARFTIRDLLDDDLPTQLTGIGFSVLNHENLDQIAIFDGSTLVGQTHSQETISFQDSNLVATNNSERSFSIRVTFSNSVTDKSQFQFSVVSLEGGEPTSYSQFVSLENGSGAQSSMTGGDNKIEVTANKLIFSSIPSSGHVKRPFSVGIQAVDANNNLDLDASGSVGLTSTGSGNLAYTGQNLSSGEAIFSNIRYDVEETIDISTSSSFATEATPQSVSFTNALGIFEFTGYHLENSGTDGISWALENASFSEFTLGENLNKLNFPAHDVFSARSFNVPTPENHRYFTFSLQPTENLIDITGIQFLAKRSGSGPTSLVLRSNTENNFTTNINDQIINVGENFDLVYIPLTGYSSVSEEVVFKIYGYDASSGLGTLQLDDVVVLGNEVDETIPQFSENYPQLKNISTTSFEVAVSAQETCTLYYQVLSSSASSPNSLDVISTSPETIAIDKLGTEFSVEVDELLPTTSYSIYFVLEDEKGNYSAVPIALENITTANPNSDISAPAVNLQIPSGTISSLIDAKNEAADVFIFSMNDNSDEAGVDDGLPTSVSRLQIVPGEGNTADWSSTIKGVSIRKAGDGTSIPIRDTTISMSGIEVEFNQGDFVVANNTSEEFILSIWLKTNVIDNEVLQFEIIDGSVGQHGAESAYFNSSQFSNTFDGPVASNTFTIDVEGSQLIFSDYPGNILPSESFGLTIKAVDENGNTDIDENGSEVTLSLFSGAGTLASQLGNTADLTTQLANGDAQWSDILEYSGTDYFSLNAHIEGVFVNGDFQSGLISAGEGDLIISSGQIFNVESSLTVNGNVTIEEGGELILNDDASLQITGDFQNNGTLTDLGGETAFTGSQPQNISSSSKLTFYNLRINNVTSFVTNESDIDLTNSLKLNANASFDADGASNDKEFVLRSTASNTARIDVVESGAILSGKVTLQRFIPKSPTSGWYFLTTPIKNQTVSHWQDNLRIQGMDNWRRNADKVLYYYDERMATDTQQGSDGWQPITSHEENISQRGVDLYIFRSAFKGNGLILDNKGEPFIGDGTNPTASFEVPLSYTNSSFDGGGWNLVPNPYPCEIDWNQIGKSNELLINNFFGIWDPENRRYATFADGVSINGASQYIASGRPFFVKTDAAGQSLTFSESTKSNSNGNTFRKEKIKDLLKITLSDSKGRSDELAIRFKNAATEVYDPLFDAHKLKSTINLYTWDSLGNELAISTLPKKTGIYSIPLAAELAKKGRHYLTFSGVSSFTDSTHIYLRDHFLDTIVSVNDLERFSFFADPKITNTYQNRFEVIFAEPIYFSLEAQSGKVNEEILVNMTAEQFKDVVEANIAVGWDAEVLQFIGVEEIGIGSMKSSDFDISGAALGKLIVKWRDNQLNELQDGSAVFALRYRILSNVDETMITIDKSEFNVFSKDGIEFPALKTADGVVNILQRGYVSGTIFTESGEKLSDVNVEITGDLNAQIKSDESGEYRFDVVEGGSYAITVDAEKDDQTDGIDMLDVVKTRRHLENIQRLENNYRVRAADVDKTKSIDEADIDAMKAIVLKNTNVLPLDKAWVFLPQTLDLSENPFKAAHSAEFEYADDLQINFVGIKMGDVDASYATPIPASGDVMLKTSAFSLGENEKIAVSFEAATSTEAVAYQLTITFDPHLIDIIDVNPADLPGILSYNITAPGKLAVIWESGAGIAERLNENASALEIAIRARKKINSSIGLFSSADHENESFLIDQNLDKLRINFSASITGIAGSSEGLILLQNSPNPVSGHTNFKFYLPVSEEAEFRIVNAVGEVIYETRGVYQGGWHEISWDIAAHSATDFDQGVYLYSIKAGEKFAVKKMVVE